MRKEKQFLLEEVSGKIGEYKSFVIASYLGVSANQVHAFRRRVAKTGGEVEMLSKRLLILAAKESGLTLDIESLPGHIGVIFTGADPMETTKVVFDFRKESEEKLKVVGGHIDGTTLDAAAMQVLSTLPGKQEMRAQFLALLQAPMAQTLSVMNALVASVVYCLDNKSKQGE